MILVKEEVSSECKVEIYWIRRAVYSFILLAASLATNAQSVAVSHGALQQEPCSTRISRTGEGESALILNISNHHADTNGSISRIFLEHPWPHTPGAAVVAT